MISKVYRHSRNLFYATILATVPILAFPQETLAGSCTAVSLGVYTCSGAAGADGSQNLTGATLSITTEPGFGLTTPGGGFFLRATNGLTFVDDHGSTITANASDGIYARNTNGLLSITTTGTVTGGQNYAYGTGIFASNKGDVFIKAVNVSGISGVYVSDGGSGPVSASISVTTSGTVAARGGAGVVVELSFSDFILRAPILGNPNSTIDVTTSDVSTAGTNGVAVGVLGGGSVDIDTRLGALNTSGNGSAGVFAMSVSPQYRADIKTGAITTQGNGAYGIAVAALGYSAPDASSAIIIRNSGPILSSGMDGGGIVALSWAETGKSAPVTINADANINGSGRNAVGIAASSISGSVAVNVGSGVSIMGGWSPDPAELSTSFSGVDAEYFYYEVYKIGTDLPAAGIVVFSGENADGPAMKITNDGSVGALNDRAITMGSTQAQLPAPMPSPVPIPPRPDPVPSELPPIQELQVDNRGDITGYVTFWDGAPHTVKNTGNFNVRHFADTDGDGIRDTKRVSISDFGSVDNSGAGTFNNLAGGTVKMAPVANAPTTDDTNFYVPTTGTDNRPLENAFYDLNREGVVQGQFVNLATFNNAGTIDLRGSAVGNTLVMTGNDVANGSFGNSVFVSDGGSLLLNAKLNAGIPLTGQTGSYSDMLIVDQTRLGAGGPTIITVSNVGGTGAYTPGNGIELVEVRNKQNSASGVFVLNGDYVTNTGEQAVVSGAYAYKLFHGGVATDASDGNWYLRSAFISTVPEVPEKPEVPLYNPGVPVYESFPQHLIELIRVPTMQQRVGNRYWRNPQPARTPQTVFCKDASQNFRCTITNEQAGYYVTGTDGRAIIEDSAIWTRIEGSHNHVEPAVTTSGSTYDSNVWRLQAGLDGLLKETKAGSKLIGGINISYGTVSTDVKSLQSYGDMTTGGYGVGATLTWLEQNGFYIDGQANVTWFDSELKADNVGRLIDGNNGFGYSLSVETGKKIDLNDVWTVTPQAQLVYSKVDFDSFTDPFGATVSLDDGDSLKGRLGLSADRSISWKDDGGKTRRSHIYGIANLYYEFLNGTQVDVSGTKFKSRPERLSGGLGLGGTYNWNDDHYSVFGEVGVDTSLQNFGDSYSVKGTTGLRIKW